MLSKVKFDVIAGLYYDFLNYIIENEFYITDIKNTDVGFTATCLAQDYKKIARASKKFQCRTKVIKRKGAYFKVRLIIARKGILLGALLLVICLTLYTNIVWKIDITVDSPVIKEDIYRLLYASDIYVGSIFSEENKKAAVQKIFIEVDNIGYVILNFEKGVMSCEVEETINKLPYLENQHIGNITSSADGVITDLRVYDGFANVVLGQSVQKGEILVSASEINKRGDLIQVQPRAYIKAYCSKEYSSEVDLEKEVEVRNGVMQKQLTIKLLGKSIVVKKAKIDNWEIYDSKTQFEFINFLGFRLPITVENIYYYQKELLRVSKDENIAEQAGKNIIQTIIEADNSVIEVERMEYTKENTGNSVKIFCTVFGYYDITK